MKRSTFNNEGASEFRMLDISTSTSVMMETVPYDVHTLFADSAQTEYGIIPSKDPLVVKEYVKWGDDNQMPYNVIDRIERDEVLSQNKLFNTQICYGQGVRFYDKATGKVTTNEKVLDFIDENKISEFFAGIIQDMKYFYWSMSVILLDGNDNIVGIRRMPVENVRLGRADSNGVISKAYYANWREDAEPLQEENVQEYDLLNPYAPWRDLAIRMGRMASPVDGKMMRRTSARMFALMVSFPVPGSRYYPVPYYASVFRDDWLEIKKLTQLRLKAGIKNTNAIRYHVEIQQKYWIDLWTRKGVRGNKKLEAAEQEKEYDRIKAFLSDVEASGKALVSEFMTDVTGKETHNIRINTIDTGKQGGEWTDEVTESCNMLCYADGIHPNLIGAVPGKTQVNNSGSDKRELYTMKQAMEDIWHDIISQHFILWLRYEGLHKEIGFDVPIVQLTTLDNHIDAIKAVREGTDTE